MTPDPAKTTALPQQRDTAPRVRERNRRDKRDPRLSIAELFSVERARRLWESLPEERRRDHFDAANMPEDYLSAFSRRTIDKERGWFTQSLSMRGLPEPMVWELAWCVHQQVADGYNINTMRMGELRRGRVLAVEHGSPAARAARSLTALTHEEWGREIRGALMRTNASANPHLPGFVENGLKHLQDRLAHAYHDGEWWLLNVWNPALDRRIPQREHEPYGRTVANFSQLTTDWFREAAKWWLSVQLSTERYVWSSVKSRLDHLKWFQWYIDRAGCVGPHLVASPEELRTWLRGFVDLLNNHTAMTGANKGGRLAKNSRRGTLVTIEAFYRWMYDNRAEAVRVLGDRRWDALGAHHSVLFRLEDKPRPTNQPPDDMALKDEVISKITTGSGVLAAPGPEGGLDDRQAFHALMLLIRTGRRMNEVLMMDFEPLLPLLMTGRQQGVSRTVSWPGSPTSRRRSPVVIRRRSRSTRRASTSYAPNRNGLALPLPADQEQPARQEALRLGNLPQQTWRADQDPGDHRQRRPPRQDLQDPYLPAHASNRSDQRWGPHPRRHALLGACHPNHDHALRQDPGRDGGA
ncbi:hypothetical protein [Streptomyces sp. E2N166]|uniref:hypothetical protein n=1 Tax=Streptomyces sp. E2N166 TaxID=1851909 RepID=UPI001EE9773C|nr:hypothetical protein [Streptomyces sp. E2N166]